MSEKLRIAVPRGAMFGESLDLLESVGYSVDAVRENDRKLFFAEEGLITMRPSDVITYVQQGSADVGITGKDVIREEQNPEIYELLDLGYAGCRMVLAKPQGKDLDAIAQRLGRLKIATKYVDITEKYFDERKIKTQIIEVKGSVELAPIVGMADAIVDITATGSTLRENGLEIVDELFYSSARLITNPVAYRLKADRIDPLVEQVRSVMEKV